LLQLSALKIKAQWVAGAEKGVAGGGLGQISSVG